MEEIYRKLKDNVELSEEEIKSLVWDSEQVYEEEGADHRWQREIFTVVKVENKFYGICWMRGLTESQESNYYEQPFEVACENKTEVVKKEIWKPISEVQNTENNKMIVVKQLPVIEEQLRQVSAEIDEKVKNAVALVCTEQNVKTIKEIRANLNKESKEFEDKRKQVKAEVLKPYEDFEKVYKECIIDKYKTADAELKNKIDAVENELKTNKKNEVINYFNEYLKLNNIDFVTFENANINVTLTASMKSLKEQAKSFIDKIADDLNLIDTQEHKAEILVEYKQTFNVSQAITTVTNRFKAIEEEKAKQEREKELQNFIIETARESDRHAPTIEEVPQMTFNSDFKIVSNKKEVKLKLLLNDEQYEELQNFLECTYIEYEVIL